jgi:hypothetical protein
MLAMRGALRLRFIALSTSLLVLSVFLALPVSAQGNSSISQEFKTKDGAVSSAALVGIEKDNSNTIALANMSEADKLLGVVGAKPLIELSGGSSGVQVVTSGLTLALVSDINGKVVNGDRVTASPIEGVGMKATQSAVIVGIAQGDLASVSTETRSVTAKDGKKQTVHIGLLPVQVGVAYYTVDEGKASYVPAFLQELANNVSGRNVSPVRVLVAALILLLLFISITVLLYSAVRSSIISIGRNPLSESAVRKSLTEVGLTVGAVLLFAVLIIYLVLTV